MINMHSIYIIYKFYITIAIIKDDVHMNIVFFVVAFSKYRVVIGCVDALDSGSYFICICHV